MREGVILVDGASGEEAGRRMRRGLIAIASSATGDCPGRGMIAGSLFVFGTLGACPGVGMKRGTIAAFGADRPELLPTFADTGHYRFPFLAIYLKQLSRWGFPVPPDVFSLEMERYNGDLADDGQGEVLVRTGSNGR